MVWDEPAIELNLNLIEKTITKQCSMDWKCDTDDDDEYEEKKDYVSDEVVVVGSFRTLEKHCVTNTKQNTCTTYSFRQD